jgi:hypothetical protein
LLIFFQVLTLSRAQITERAAETWQCSRVAELEEVNTQL